MHIKNGKTNVSKWVMFNFKKESIMKKVYINFSLPKTCDDCPFIGRYEQELFSRHPHCCCELYWNLNKQDFRVDKNTRRKDCPLREISNHDRAIKQHMYKQAYNDFRIKNELGLYEEKIRKQERKKVVQEIGQQLGLIIDGQKQVCCDGDMTADKTIMAVLDQVER